MLHCIFFSVFLLVICIGFTHASGSLSIADRRKNLEISCVIIFNVYLLIRLLIEHQMTKFAVRLHNRINEYIYFIQTGNRQVVGVHVDTHVMDGACEMPEMPMDDDELNELMSFSMATDVTPCESHESNPVQLPTAPFLTPSAPTTTPKASTTILENNLTMDPSITPSIQLLRERSVVNPAPVTRTHIPTPLSGRKAITSRQRVLRKKRTSTDTETGTA